MENLYLQDGTDIKIEEGTGISRIITYVDSYPALGELAAELTRDNLSDVQIGAEGAAGTGAYRNMELTEPHFRITDQGERLKVVFGLRQRTEEELKAPAIATAAAYLSDEQALTVKALYPLYQGLIGATVPLGTRFTYEGMLYKTIQDNLLIQEQYVPGEGTESLYVCLDGTHAGTLADPIPVPETISISGMEYEYGKYYKEGNSIYLCKRGGLTDEQAEAMYGQKEILSFPPSALVGQYFELVTI